MIKSFCARGALWLAMAGLLTTGCPSPDGGSLTITDPITGTSLTLADDTDPGSAGLQIDVAASSMNLDSGTPVDLRVDGAVTSSGAVDATGAVTFADVTLATGTHTLVAVTREGGIESDAVVVVVSDACFAVSFVEPTVVGGEVRLGPADDTDGEPCGATFETSVVVATAAPNGATAQLFVNATPRASTTVTGGVARFEGVALDNRGASSNALRVVVTNVEGLACEADFPAEVFVECDGPSCAISAPDTDVAFLSSLDDTSAADGFQTDFEVSTDSATEGRLILDGDEPGAVAGTFSGGTATYGNVSLSEGIHRVVAECTDSLGNTTRSGVAEWTVDITECGVGIDNPVDDQLFGMDDDIDGGTAGVQIGVDGSAGADCTGLRVGPCPTIDGASFGAADSIWSSTSTLATSASQELCAQTRDEAGNVSEARVTVRFSSDAPQLEIGSPATDTRFNQMSDLTPGDTTCAQAFDVYCDALGEMVELWRSDTSTMLGAAPCMADASVPSPYTGRAAFASLALPNREDGMSFTVEARALAGTSSPISIFSDCNAPELAILRPRCGAVLNPGTQDEDLATPGFQYLTRVSNPSLGDVTLTIRPAGGGAPIYMATVAGAANTRFPDASYSAGGELAIEATSTDSAGNVGRSPACSVTVPDLPSVSFLEPTHGEGLNPSDDCSAGRAGLQIAVRGESDAPAGSLVTVRFGSTTAMTTTNAAGRFIVCVNAEEGPAITITVEVTDTRGTGSASIVVSVDTVPPVTGIAPVTATVLDRRDGIVRFQWTAVGDGPGGTAPLASYEMRCDAAPITTELEWEDARVVPIVTVPRTPGTVQREDVDGFRPGEDLFCSLRGLDIGASLTPIDGNVTVSIAFLTTTVDGVGTAGFGREPQAIGDINGDMIDDVLTGGTDSAHLWYGTAAGLPTVPSVRFTSTVTSFGTETLGLGDINGDGLNDFAVAAPLVATFAGRVFVFFGRPAATPFLPVCDTGLPTCAPDVILDRPAGTAIFGFSISSSDFDGDGVNDLIVGAPGVASFAGEVYVILGGPHLTSGSTFVVSAGAATAPPGFVIRPPAGVTGFGNGVAGMGGSVVGDASHDLVVGAPGSTASPPSNLVLVEGLAHSGSGIDVVPGSAMQIIDTDIQSRYGVVAPAGDVNGDGFLDVHAYEAVGGSRGRVQVYLGSATGLSSTGFLLLNDGPASLDGDQWGAFLANGRHAFLGNHGDLDRDLIVDMAVGSAEFAAVPHGTVEVFYGMSVPTDRQRSEATPSLAGMDGRRTVGFLGDVDGDGFNDVGIGEAAANGGAGRLIILH